MAMRYRKLGKWGIKVSEISLGAWITYGDVVEDLKAVKRITAYAYDNGVNFFDNADVYASGKGEELMSKALAQFERSTLVLSSKCYWPMSDEVNNRGLSRKHVHESMGKSLKRMKLDYLDLYFAHRYDEEVPMEEIVSAYSNLIDRGYALYWGTSEWPAARISEAVQFAKANHLHPPVVEQPHYSMLYRERVEQQILPETERNGLGMVVWSPLAGGVLTGKYDNQTPKGSRLTQHPEFMSNFMTKENLERVKKLKKIADELDLTRTQLALAWVLRQPGISSAITGATKFEQIKESLGGASVDLPQDAVDQIEKILESK